MFKAKTLLDEIKNTHLKILESCKNSLNKSKFDLDFQRLNKILLKNVQIFQLILL